MFQALAPRMMKLLPFTKKGKDTERKFGGGGVKNFQYIYLHFLKVGQLSPGQCGSFG